MNRTVTQQGPNISWPMPQTNGHAASASSGSGDPFALKTALISSSSPDSTGSSSKRTSLWTDFKPWIKDVLSCLLACLALLAIVITLAAHNGHTLPNWKFGITVNALVSVFAVIWKAAMVAPVANAISQLKWSWFQKPRPLIDLARFDEASRGVLGSMWLIGRLRGMHLAWVGALISIFAIASDPFIQQVVKYSSCSRVASNATASIARTNLYSAALPEAGVDEATLTLPMQAAVFEGAYNIFSQVQPVCVTGNCTFPIYSTVGMCSACEDISHEVEPDCHNDFCRWTLPSNLTLRSPTHPLESMVMRSKDMTENFQEIAAKDVVSQTQIISITGVLDQGNKGALNLTEGTNTVRQSVMALQCSLWPCVRTYRSEVIGGSLNEKLLSTVNMTYNFSTGLGSFDAAPMPCLINGSYHNASSFGKSNIKYQNEIPWLLPGNESVLLPSQCVYRYYNPIGMVNHLVTFLHGHVVWDGTLLYAKPSWIGKLFHNDTATLGTVNEAWANLASSITAQMRRTPTPGTIANIAGQTWYQETCIAVQWQWLTYSLVLLLGTIVLLALTIVKSLKDTDVQIWKSSPLPLLFHGLEADLLNCVEEADDLSAMHDLSKRITVSLGRDGSHQALMGNLSQKK